MEFFEFLYFRNWTFSVSCMAVVGAFLLVSPFQGDLGAEGQAPLPMGIALRIFIAILIPLVAGLFVQFFISRQFRSPYVSAVHVPFVSTVALLGYALICIGLGTDRSLAIEELTYNCLAKPSRYCARTVRENKGYVELFPEEQRREILRLAYSGTRGRRFESLTPEKQAFVKENYREVVMAHDRRNFAEVLKRTQNIFMYVEDYGDARTYETIAKRGLASVPDKK
ncbi:MAG: hypothetical protein ACXWQO_03550 [Bdellovibrionota bacterium]